MTVLPNARCQRCETLPRHMVATGLLSLWLPTEHTCRKAARALRCEGHGASGTALLDLPMDGHDLLTRLDAVCEVLTSREIDESTILMRDSGVALSHTDIPHARPLRRQLALLRAGPVLEMMAQERLTSVFQPIVHTRNPDRIHGHECLLRGLDPDGKLLSPGPILEMARDGDFLFQLDLAARRSAIREAARHGIPNKVFINFAPASIYDPAFCLRSTVHAIKESGLASGNIVFEVVETDHARDPKHLQNILAHYRQQGFGVALDDIGSGYSSLNLIHQIRPDYLKLDMELVRGVHQDKYKAVILKRMLEIAQDLGIATIAEGIETKEEFDWVSANGADYMQGYYIAKPATTPLLNF